LKKKVQSLESQKRVNQIKHMIKINYRDPQEENQMQNLKHLFALVISVSHLPPTALNFRS